MGNQSNRRGKYILHYIVVSCIIAALNIVSCAPIQNEITEIKSCRQLDQYRENLVNGLFETVILKGRQVVEKNETGPPADVALYALGVAYAHPAYEDRDYVLSQHFLEKLVEDFPDSRLTPEAKLYISLFRTISAREKTVVIEKAKAKQNVPVSSPGRVVENQNFQEAVEKNVDILNEVGNKKPADVALYNLGLIYAHNNNPAKDYEKSHDYFQQLSNQFPDSDLTEEAQVWLGLFKTIKEMQQIDIEIDLQKKQLTN